MIPPNDQSLYNPTSPIENVLPSDNMANQNEDYYKQKFLQHAALSEHYARQKQANAGDSMLYYQFAELEYYHKSRALHYKAFFRSRRNYRRILLIYTIIEKVLLSIK